MRRLTKVEEKQIILKALEVDEYLGEGSSRAVYSLGDGTCVKIANDIRGQFQNKTEIEAFKEHGRERLAEIFAYGKYIVVMEQVDAYENIYEIVCDFEYAEDNYYGEEEEHYARLRANGLCSDDEGWEPFPDFSLQDTVVDGLDASQYKQILELKNWMDYNFGETVDNYQMGMRDDGTFVSYDYGYMPHNHEMSVSERLWKVIRDTGRMGFLLEVADRLY